MSSHHLLTVGLIPQYWLKYVSVGGPRYLFDLSPGISLFEFGYVGGQPSGKYVSESDGIPNRAGP